MTGGAPLRFNSIESGLARCGLYRAAMWMAESRWRYQLTRAYLDAANTDRLNSQWRKITGTGKDVASADGGTSRDRARYLAANDPYCAHAADVLLDAVVGEGIRSQLQIVWSRDAKVTEDRNGQLESLKALWGDTADYRLRMTWPEMQEMFLREIMVSGEGLRRRVYRKPDEMVGEQFRHGIPLCYEFIDVQRLSSFCPRDVVTGNEMCDGIEMDAAGRPVAYHIAGEGYVAKTERVPADQIDHAFRVDRPGQHRGITWFAPIITEANNLREVKLYADVARKVQAAIALVKTRPVGATRPGPLGLNPVSGASTSTTPGDKVKWLEPGMIYDAGEGEVKSHIPTPSNDLDVVTKLHLRAIGIGLGLSYEWVSGDYSEVTFASGRLSDLATWRRIRRVHQFICKRTELPAHYDWVNAAMAVGAISRVPRGADVYAVRFSRPRKEWGVNPTQEVSAAANAVEKGLSTLRDEIEQRGGDWQEFIKQLNAERKFGDEFGFALHKALYADSAAADSALDTGDTQ